MRHAVRLLPIVLLVACAPAMEQPAQQPTVRWSASLEAGPEFDEARASVTAVRTAGGSTVQIEFTGGEPGARHVWHVHSGTCQTGGGIVGDPGRYPPLRVGVAGRALETAVIDVELQPGQRYHVNVHRSADDLATIVACGDLREVGSQ
jgi:FtsP/CotA-like multicopper oxidase with cupredoxin domain